MPCRVLRRYAVNGRCTASETAETARRRDGNRDPLALLRDAPRDVARRDAGHGPTAGRDATADSIGVERTGRAV